MSSPSRLSNPAARPPPLDPTVLATAIERLRAEHQRATSPAVQAVLLHEIAVLEESLGDEAAAAHDQLDAVNTDPDFRESLERLISIVGRWESRRNLAKLFERLVQVSDTPSELVRARLGKAGFHADEEGELELAREILTEMAEDSPGDPSVLLALEQLAARLDDAALRERALAARADVAEDPTLRGLLWTEVSRLLQSRNAEAALEAVDRAVAQGAAGTFEAVRAKEVLGATLARPDLVAAALQAQGDLMRQAFEDPEFGDDLGVPTHRRSAAHAAEAWLRASEAQRANAGPVTELLDQALGALPDERLLLRLRRAHADAEGDREATRALLQRELAADPDDASSAAVWLRLAELRVLDGDRDGGFEALKNALRIDPLSLRARALELDLLAAHDDASSYARALGSAAEALDGADAKVDLLLASAVLHAALGSDLDAAREVLERARALEARPRLVARVARLIASTTGDTAEYERSTRAIAAHGADDETTSAWLELGRAALLRGVRSEALAAFAGVTATPEKSWLGHALRAYAAPLAGNLADAQEPSRSWGSVATLAALEATGEAARGLHFGAALRALVEHDEDGAMVELREVHVNDPASVATASALAAIARERNAPGMVAEVLERTAESTTDAALAALLWVASGLASFRAGDRKRAVESFLRAAEHRQDAAEPLLAWAMFSAEPDDPVARRQALDALGASDAATAALERFGLEVGSGGSSSAAADALSALADPMLAETSPTLAAAGELGRALWSSGPETHAMRLEALEAFARRSPEAERIARVAAHELALSAGLDAPALLETSRRWAQTDHGVAPVLEWLSAAIAARDVEAELTARETLAERLGGPVGAALRASVALVAMLSDLEPRAASEGKDPAERLARLELAPPTTPPSARARALRDAGPAFGEDSLSVATAMAGFNELAAGDFGSALDSFRTFVARHPEEVIGWEGLRAVALASGDRETLAEASAALGDAVGDPAVGAKLWEEAAGILLDELHDQERGEFALARAVDRDVRRHVAFDRLFRLVRTRKDGNRLLELATRRLTVAEEPAEIVKLLWERARVLRELGDREGALEALEKVAELEPEHVGVLALKGEIGITLGRFAEAAASLARLAQHAEAPRQQRLMSGMAAVDLYEIKLSDSTRALSVLKDLERQGLDTPAVRERLARAAAKLGEHALAVDVLEKLMHGRDSAEGRAEAARLAMALRRDELGSPATALDAVTRLLEEQPADGEALDLVLGDVFPREVSRGLLEGGQQALVQELMDNPVDPERLDRLARIAESLQRPQLRQAVLGALIALGADPSDIDPELAALDEQVAHVPHIAVDDATLPELADPEDRGPMPALLAAIAGTVAAALGPGLAAFNVSKRDRLDPRAGLPLRNEIAAWAGALGVGEFEVYVGAPEPYGVWAVVGDPPAIVVGRAVTAPLTPYVRQLVARELLALRRGTTVLRHRASEEVHALLVAACRIAGVPVASPPFALLAEFERELGKEMPRRVRRALPELARPFAASNEDPAVWIPAAIATLDRMAALATGDVSWVLAPEFGRRGRMATSLEADKRSRRLLTFVLSPLYLELRERLGMGVR